MEGTEANLFHRAGKIRRRKGQGSGALDDSGPGRNSATRLRRHIVASLMHSAQWTIEKPPVEAAI